MRGLQLALKKPDNRQAKIKSLQADLDELNHILERLSQALLSTNMPLETVVDMLGKQEERKKTLERGLEELQRVVMPTAFDEKRLRGLLTAKMETSRSLMLGDVDNARKAL